LYVLEFVFFFFPAEYGIRYICVTGVQTCALPIYTEIEKFKSLVEDVDFGSEDMFREKLATLKENYFPKTQGQFDLDYEDGGTAQDIDTTEAMSAYMSAISRNKERAQ